MVTDLRKALIKLLEMSSEAGEVDTWMEVAKLAEHAELKEYAELIEVAIKRLTNGPEVSSEATIIAMLACQVMKRHAGDIEKLSKRLHEIESRIPAKARMES